MGTQHIMEQLLFKNRQSMHAIVADAWRDYMLHIGHIAEDIYDSCIQDYYTKYGPPEYPKVYGRHGDKTGFNLYSANDIEYDDYDPWIKFEPSFLEEYDGKGDRRPKVLKGVMIGLRGTKSSKTPSEWPQEWFTKYPNRYSKYDDWWSSGYTIKEIFTDFMDNVLKDTEDLFWNYVEMRL